MVHLHRIYTRSGDDGTTALGSGERLPKHHLRVEAYGTVDEASSVIGLVLAGELGEPYRAWLGTVQNDLFDVGSDLCRPGAPGEEGDVARLGPHYTARLETWIDQVNEGLQPLSTFVLPGGSPAAAHLHLARTVCRRAERCVTALIEAEGAEQVNQETVRYLNRLSDLLFVLARAENDFGAADILWDPGAGGGA